MALPPLVFPMRPSANNVTDGLTIAVRSVLVVWIAPRLLARLNEVLAISGDELLRDTFSDTVESSVIHTLPCPVPVPVATVNRETPLPLLSNWTGLVFAPT